jgi:hypothetical protein
MDSGGASIESGWGLQAAGYSLSHDASIDKRPTRYHLLCQSTLGSV